VGHEVNCFHSPAEEKANYPVFIRNPPLKFLLTTRTFAFDSFQHCLFLLQQRIQQDTDILLDTTAGPPPVHEQIANRAAGIIFSATLQTDGSDCFQSFSFYFIVHQSLEQE